MGKSETEEKNKTELKAKPSTFICNYYTDSLEVIEWEESWQDRTVINCFGEGAKGSAAADGCP